MSNVCHLTPEEVTAALQAMKDRGMTLRAIAAKFDHLTYGDIDRILQGIMPADRYKRQDLSLPSEGSAPVCPIHNKVHIGRCPGTAKPKPLDYTNIKELRRQINDREEVTDETYQSMMSKLFEGPQGYEWEALFMGEWPPPEDD